MLQAKSQTVLCSSSYLKEYTLSKLCLPSLQSWLLKLPSSLGSGYEQMRTAQAFLQSADRAVCLILPRDAHTLARALRQPELGLPPGSPLALKSRVLEAEDGGKSELTKPTVLLGTAFSKGYGHSHLFSCVPTLHTVLSVSHGKCQGELCRISA